MNVMFLLFINTEFRFFCKYNFGFPVDRISVYFIYPIRFPKLDQDRIFGLFLRHSFGTGIKMEIILIIIVYIMHIKMYILLFFLNNHLIFSSSFTFFTFFNYRFLCSVSLTMNTSV